MGYSRFFSRRTILGGAVAGLGLGLLAPAFAQAAGMKVFKDPNCGCCGGWVTHLKQAGYSVAVEDVVEVEAVKRRLGVPSDLWACHTATVAGYTLEGHVPAHAVARLLKERPRIVGLAVPGMPAGSPGMEGDYWEVYEVVGFEGPRRIVFGRYRGAMPA